MLLQTLLCFLHKPVPKACIIRLVMAMVPLLRTILINYFLIAVKKKDLTKALKERRSVLAHSEKAWSITIDGEHRDRVRGS